ncbi:MAG TPA: sugar ABC transporter permease [Acetobacteraceae bacterium]|nr:sugar ABC transporter permease [Acetobacteraceae bacterium]
MPEFIQAPLVVPRLKESEALRRRRYRRHGSFRWMLLPGLGFVALMIGFPLLDTLWLSLQHFSFGSSPHFAGLANYGQLLADPKFWQGLRVTFTLYLLSLASQLIAGLYLAVLLHRARRLRGLLRTLLVSPFVMPPVVVGMMWLVILDPSLGIANWLLQLIGIPPALWLASPQWVIPTVAMIDTWQWAPFVALILLAGLQTLPIDVFEAAVIDGARGWGLFRRVTLPLLAPSIVTAATLRSVDLLRFFDIIYITTQGGPGDASETLNIYAFKQGFVFLNIGYASALMVTLTAVVIGAVLALMRFRRATQW